MTKEQIANLRIGDEVWIAKFELGYNKKTGQIVTLIDQCPKRYVIKRYLCDADFNITGYETEGGRCYNRFDTKNLVDGVIEFIKYAPTKKEITEWYVSRRRKCKEVYLKKLEEVTKELEEI